MSCSTVSNVSSNSGNANRIKRSHPPAPMRRFHDPVHAILSIGPLALLLLLATSMVHAATLTVDTDAPAGVGGDGSCTLTEAITDMNAGSASADCPNSGDPFGSNDTIQFAPALIGATIALFSGSLPNIEVDLEMIGPVPGDPAGITISGNDNVRIFVLQSDDFTTTNVSFSDLTLTQGNTSFVQSGGAIASFTANVELNNVDLIDNVAAIEGGAIALFNGNSLTLTNSRVIGNSVDGTTTVGGGGLSVNGDLILINSEVSGNSTLSDNAGGGGVFSRGAVTLVNSIVTGNTTAGSAADGGGLAIENGSLTINSGTIADNQTLGNGADGGGIFLDASDAAISAATISGNDAALGNGGGILASNSDINMVNSTVSGNSAAGDGGGILSSGGGTQIVTLVHSTVAFNTADGPNADGVDLSSGTLNLSNSLIVQGDPGEPACRFAADSFVNTLATDDSCTGTATTAAAINLLPLANYGGNTATHALGLASVAIDAAPNDGLCQNAPPGGAGAADQRGVTRPQPVAGLCDLGAYEADGSAPLPVTLGIALPAPIELAEAGGSVTVQACLPDATSASEDINISLSVSGTATPNVDHNVSDGSTIVITTGSTCAGIFLTALDDILVEGDETVTIDIDTVTSDSNSAFEGSPPQQVNATILDDDAAVRQIPTLSSMGLLIMILALALLGILAMRRRSRLAT